MRVLLVEPYLGGSRRAWAEGYAAASAPDVDVQVIGHPGRFWRWRQRGAAVTLADAAAGVVARVGRPDVVLASDLLDLPGFLGLTRRTLGDPAVALYLHAHQAVHPTALASARPDDGPALVQWSAMLAADHVFVNSAHHLACLAPALSDLLARQPDERHDARLDDVLSRTTVLGLGADLSGLIDARRPAESPFGPGPPVILWNHRWDHDKQPEVFFRALRRLDHDGVAYRVALAGANVRSDPREFTRAAATLGERLVHVGHAAPERYRELLLGSDVVVSTAAHEFFGLAVLEAIAAGCVPVLPDALAYPELVPTGFHRAVLSSGYRGFVDRLRIVLGDLPRARAAVAGLREAVGDHDWSVVAPRYDAALEQLASGVRPAAGSATLER